MTASLVRSFLYNGSLECDQVHHRRDGIWLAVKHTRLQNSEHLVNLLRKLHEIIPEAKILAVWTTQKPSITFEFRMSRRTQ
jgi:hypothetical protein